MVENVARDSPANASLFTSQVRELVALGAAVACNCQMCLRYRHHAARQLGVSDNDMRLALDMARKVKESSAGSAWMLATRLLDGTTGEGSAKSP